MKHIYAVEDREELQKYQAFVSQIRSRLDDYVEYLNKEFEVTDLPRAILWTSGHTATELISNIPVPAYTNDYRIVMTPELESWRKIYLSQLDAYPEDCSQIRAYYTECLSQNHVLQILGHELAHHSQLFCGEYEDAVWFEEGMVEYISRRYFLSDAEFEAEAQINRKLAALFARYRGAFSLEEFSPAIYQNDYAGIFAAYWSSFLAVSRIVAEHGGDIPAVFRAYRRWLDSGREKNLAQWFCLEI